MHNDLAALPEFAVPPWALGSAQLARVTRVDDPDSQARVQVALHAMGTEAPLLWARVACPFAGASRGGFFIPEVDDEVLVLFVGGDARVPVVVGGLWHGAATPPETLSGNRVDRWTITGKAGTRVAIVEESDATAKVEISTPGGATMVITDEGGGRTQVDCAGNTVKIEPAGITVTAAGKVKVQASQVEVTAGMVKVDTAMAKFSGIVKCELLQTNSVVSASYTPGAGNVW